jgi:hypothetical protein
VIALRVGDARAEIGDFVRRDDAASGRVVASGSRRGEKRHGHDDRPREGKITREAE